MGQAEIFHMTAMVLFGLCGLLAAASVILYFSLHIGEVIGETTGRTARRQIAEYEAKQAGLESEQKYRNRQERLKEGLPIKKEKRKTDMALLDDRGMDSTAMPVIPAENGTVLLGTETEDGTVLLGMPTEHSTTLPGGSQDDGTTLLLGAQ